MKNDHSSIDPGDPGTPGIGLGFRDGRARLECLGSPGGGFRGKMFQISGKNMEK